MKQRRDVVGEARQICTATRIHSEEPTLGEIHAQYLRILKTRGLADWPTSIETVRKLDDLNQKIAQNNK
jgi:hypothetical protein